MYILWHIWMFSLCLWIFSPQIEYIIFHLTFIAHPCTFTYSPYPNTPGWFWVVLSVVRSCWDRWRVPADILSGGCQYPNYFSYGRMVNLIPLSVYMRFMWISKHQILTCMVSFTPRIIHVLSKGLVGHAGWLLHMMIKLNWWRTPTVIVYWWCSEILTCVTAVLVIGTLVLPVGNPLLQSPAAQPPSSSSSSAPLRSFGILSGLSAAFAISLLFIMAQTYEERWIPCRACVSASRLPLCVRVCALVWGRSTCSVVSVEERAELATLYVQAEVTAQAQWTPLRERVRGSPFWAPRNRWERGEKKGGVQSNERLTQHSVSTQTLGLDVRNGRSVQPQEVGGLRSCSRAAFSLAVGASRSVRTKTSVPMCASCLRRRRHVCCLCLCLCRGRGRDIVSAAGGSSSRQAVIAENGALRVYCAAIMERLMCHTFINTLSGACMVFATHLFANCAFMTLIRPA